MGIASTEAQEAALSLFLLCNDEQVTTHKQSLLIK